MLGNIVIVYSEDTKEHADYLRDLIGLNDDTDEKVIGIKDGLVKATTRLDTNYTAENDSSAQKVIYVGECKGAESTIRHARYKISEHGLRCGWFGNKAVIYTDKKLTKDEDYTAFCTYGQAVAERMKESLSKVEDTKGQKISKALSIISLAVGSVVPAAGLPGAVNLTLQGVKRAKEIKIQQYDTMIRAFYLDHLNDFIEGRE